MVAFDRSYDILFVCHCKYSSYFDYLSLVMMQLCVGLVA